MYPVRPAFSEMRVKAAVQSCPSVSECIMQVNLESGIYWTDDIRQKVRQQANLARPITRTSAMQYNPDSKHWMVK